MIKPEVLRWTVGIIIAHCLLATAGCSAVANSPTTASVCYGSKGTIDTTLTRQSDCDQAGGTWKQRPK